jgi:hypothetical protein
MRMNKPVFAIVFVLVTGAMFGLCANAHIDFFPCEYAERDMNYRGLGEAPLTKGERTCSFMAHNRGVGPDGGYEKLTGVGWAVLVAFCAGVGAIAGVGLGMALKKKNA